MNTSVAVIAVLGLGSRAVLAQAATEQERVRHMMGALRNLVTAEEAYRHDSRPYTRDYTDKPPAWFRVDPGVIGLRITLTTDGWMARVGHEGTGTICVIYVGSTAIPPATQQGEPACRSRGDPADTAAARAAIAAGNARWVAAFQRGDAGAVAALFAEDAVQLRRSGAVVQGRAAIQASFRQLFRDNGSADATITTADVWLVDERAYESGRFTFTFHPAGKAPVTNAGRYVTVWERQTDGTWKIVVDFGVPSDTPP